MPGSTTGRSGVLGAFARALWLWRSQVPCLGSEQQQALTHEQLVDIYSMADKNGDDKVTWEEVQTLYDNARKAAGRKEAIEMLEHLDKDGDGVVSAEEFTHGTNHDDEFEFEADKYRVADRDHDGSLSLDELVSIASPETDPEMQTFLTQDLMNTAVSDGASEMGLDEFLNVYGVPSKDSEEYEDTLAHGKDLFSDLDVDISGDLDLDELMPWATGSAYAMKSLKVGFNLADVNEDGHLSQYELTSTREALHETDAFAYLQEMHELLGHGVEL
eukprot:TRINITY_DN18763_c0_g1_i1.p1 TRINITY_DN18763_c0_g1~~TRINITY_DN18763_c0_g1_i1.p1  ORF type:complete len:273 (-),score=59.85 TRINITY_DN18763_c0_g1_i1:28-846(-)